MHNELNSDCEISHVYAGRNCVVTDPEPGTSEKDDQATGKSGVVSVNWNVIINSPLVIRQWLSRL
jgi:hypothetical protein